MRTLTGEAIPAFRFASIKAQLRVEWKTGMKSSGGALRPRLYQELPRSFGRVPCGASAVTSALEIPSVWRYQLESLESHHGNT
jgi:hypothetical protein